jgi:hypothetical protein
LCSESCLFIFFVVLQRQCLFEDVFGDRFTCTKLMTSGLHGECCADTKHRKKPLSGIMATMVSKVVFLYRVSILIATDYTSEGAVRLGTCIPGLQM